MGGSAGSLQGEAGEKGNNVITVEGGQYLIETGLGFFITDVAILLSGLPPWERTGEGYLTTYVYLRRHSLWAG